MGEIRTIPPVLTRTEWNALLEHSLIKEASFIVYSGSGLYWPLNGSTGKIDYSGSDATNIIRSSLNATFSGSIFIKKALTCYLITGSIGIPSNVTIDSDFAVLAANWSSDYSPTALGLPLNFPPIFYNLNYSGSYGRNTNITIKNLILQGNAGQVGAEPGG